MLGDLEIKLYKPRKMLFFYRMLFPLFVVGPTLLFLYKGFGSRSELEPLFYSAGALMLLYVVIFLPYYFLTRVCYLTISERHLFVKSGIKLLTDGWDKHLLTEVSSYEFILKSFNKVLVIQSGDSKVKVYLNWLVDPKNIVGLLYYNYAPIIKNSRPQIKAFMDSL